MATEPARKRTTALAFAKGRLLLLLFFLLLMYVVVPRLGSFSESFSELGGARPLFVGLAGALVLVTYILAAGMYWLLAFKPLGYVQTLTVQTASGFTNRVLPGGIGVITMYVRYLRKKGHSLPQAVAVSGVNNALGILVHLMLLMLTLIAAPGALFDRVRFSPSPRFWMILTFVVVFVAISLLVFRRLRRYVYALGKGVVGHLASYRHRPGVLMAAVACSALLTLSYVLTFYMCCLALGLRVPLVQVFVIFTVGQVAATVTPTPGGLVGAEAGLTTGLVAYGAEASTALAAALLYRFLTYWVPLVPGFIVFVANRKLYL